MSDEQSQTWSISGWTRSPSPKPLSVAAYAPLLREASDDSPGRPYTSHITPSPPTTSTLPWTPSSPSSHHLHSSDLRHSSPSLPSTSQCSTIATTSLSPASAAATSVSSQTQAQNPYANTGPARAMLPIGHLIATGQMSARQDLGRGRRGAISGPSTSYWEGKYDDKDRPADDKSSGKGARTGDAKGGKGGRSDLVE